MAACELRGPWPASGAPVSVHSSGCASEAFSLLWSPTALEAYLCSVAGIETEARKRNAEE